MSTVYIYMYYRLAISSSGGEQNKRQKRLGGLEVTVTDDADTQQVDSCQITTCQLISDTCLVAVHDIHTYIILLYIFHDTTHNEREDILLYTSEHTLQQ